MLYMVPFTINIPQILAYIPYKDPRGKILTLRTILLLFSNVFHEIYVLHFTITIDKQRIKFCNVARYKPLI